MALINAIFNIIEYEIVIFQITNMRARGMEFLTIPDSYYTQLKKNLSKSRTKVQEDMAILQVSWLKKTGTLMCGFVSSALKTGNDTSLG